jgi:ABC-type oligopeptide transport system ATPase subunit
VAVMSEGVIVETLSADQLAAGAVTHAYSRALLAAADQPMGSA